MTGHSCMPLISLVQRHASRVTTTCDGRQKAAQDLHDSVALLSWALSNVCNVRPGDRIALMGLNTDTFFEVLLAIMDAGAVACPMNWRWSADEVAAAIDLTQPRCLFADDSCIQLALAAQAKALCPAPVFLHMTPQTAANPEQHKTASQHHQQAQATSDWHSARSLLSHTTIATTLQQLLSVAAAAAQAAAAQQQLQLQLLQPSSGPTGACLICFTSGTTGASKGAVLSHAALLHQSMAKLAAVGYNDADVYLHVAPLFHIGGLSSAFAVLLAGGQHVFMPRYSASTALQLIQRHQVTAMIAVPAMMQDITAAAAAAANTQQQQQRQQHDQPQHQLLSLQQQQQHEQPHHQLLSLQRVLVGAGGMTPQLQQAVAGLFPNAHLSTAYGMTEACSSITFITLPEQQQRMLAAAGAGVGEAAAAGVCVGWPGPGIAVRIDPTAAQEGLGSSSSSGSSSSGHGEQQQCCQHGVVGEVCTRGPHVMLGYWGMPPLTALSTAAAAAAAAVVVAQPFTPDGWLRTGDLGFLDSQGCLWLLGRAKDMIKTGGENVFAAEVESVLLRHDAVAAAAAVGLPHDRLGEQVAAAVVLRQQWEWMDDDLQQQQQQQRGASLRQGNSLSGNRQQWQQQWVVSQLVLQQHCRSAGLSPYKLPRVIVAVEALPLNSSGKVVKSELKQQMVHIQQQQQQQEQQQQHDNSQAASGGRSGSSQLHLRSRL